MKKMFSVLLAGCFSATCTPIPDATSTKTVSVTVSVLLDKTDPKLYWPSATQLLSLYHCDKQPDAAYSFRLSAISDVLQNERITRTLPAAEPHPFTLASVERQKRSEAILRFYSAVRARVDEFYSRNDTSTSLARSVCGQTIINELQYLAENKSDQNTLVIASDLREHSDFDMYAMNTIDTHKIIDWLASLNPNLPSLKGITVIFVFMPKNIEEDKAFTTISQAYKLYLEQKGAVVQIQSNL